MLTGPRIAIALSAFCLWAAPAAAAPVYDVARMDCAAVLWTLQTEGVAVLRYPSKSILRLPIFDRYVHSQKYCSQGEVARGAGVPTLDEAYCPVKKCVESRIFTAR